MGHGPRLRDLAVSGSIALMVGLAMAQPASAAVQSSNLYQQDGRSSCPGGGTVAGDAHGSAMISQTNHSNQLVVDVSLAGATPNRSFEVHVIQCQGSSDSGRPTKMGTLTTDADGNGSFHSHPIEMPAGVTGAFVGLFGPPTATFPAPEIYAAPAVLI